MAAEEDSGFSVVDKRRVHQDAEVAAESGGESGDAGSEGGSEAQAYPEGLPTLGVRDRVLMCLDILHQGAWIAMGLVADPATGRVEQDLGDAQIAIDCAAFLAGKLEGRIEEDTLREIRRVVSDLQVNFVRQKQQNP